MSGVDGTGNSRHLCDLITNCIMDTVGTQGLTGDASGTIGVAFSGGVDSTLVSGLCSEMGYDVVLLTMGFAESHDIVFAQRVNAQYLQLPHHVCEIDPFTFPEISSKIHTKLGCCDNISWHENCIGFYYVSRLANRLDISTVVTANGIDELFCGYDVYRRRFAEGASGINMIMDSKLDNEYSMMEAVNLIASEFGVRIVQPLLHQEFVRYAMTVPLSEKIRGPNDIHRKHVIRRLAHDIGVPEISYAKRKKALQYGSKIHKMLLKTRAGPLHHNT